MVKTQDQDLMEIERSGLLNQAKPKKKKKQNLQQPLKVVYISNPMRVTTSPSGFRAIVQELTGRHSDIAEILTRQPPVDFPPPPPSASRPSGGLAPLPGQFMGTERFDAMEDLFAGASELFWA
ncbi:hypothetical protein HPP92_006310 [Vanilla planifolia]|uniref:VQ domain-containing protein n=1 Tax=Vanilla planifolia TaxID=51239 RepID=A0A835RNZ4_VANPL|nr:hypothetical protein HPP92_028460 [Vanilla planifolia]KAG0489447.1 hypothetical protein HPP92_006310 [Vanilla planifolia]